MNLSGGLNLSGRSNMLGSTKNSIQFSISIFGAKLKPVFGGFKPRLKFIKFGHWLKMVVVKQIYARKQFIKIS